MVQMMFYLFYTLIPLLTEFVGKKGKMNKPNTHTLTLTFLILYFLYKHFIKNGWDKS